MLVFGILVVTFELMLFYFLLCGLLECVSYFRVC